MDVATDAELIERAAQALRPVESAPGRWLADVGAALASATGEVFTGACVGGHLGLCAEMAAAGQLVSRCDPVIRRMVAVWREPQTGVLHVLPPCGRCREFVISLTPRNLDTVVVLGPDHTATVRELVPFHGWHAEPVR